MRLAFFLLLLASFLLMNGCCEEVHFTPAHPASVQGWREFDNQGIHAIGEFVLKKGESVENGVFGVELVKTIAPKRCSYPFAEGDNMPHALMRFYKVSDRQTILEVDAIKGTTERLINHNFPVAEYRVDSIHIREINTRDKWVWFELWK